MNTDSARIRELIERPSESLAVELKRWIDPDSPEGIAKIVRTALALRNFGGGYLLIGFDNRTSQPDHQHAPVDVRLRFHIDKIQALISRFASEPFEVAVEFGKRGGQDHPIIVVPPGVKTPVAAKSDLHHGGKRLISVDDVYVRSLSANNTPSTAKASWKDWPGIAEICFDNREADIGRFVRRHLGSLTPGPARDFALAMSEALEPRPSSERLLRELLTEGWARFESQVAERAIELPEHGAWEVALVVSGEVPQHDANQSFLRLLEANNPEYTGWPVWLDSRGFADIDARPYVLDGGWEAFLATIGRGWSDHLDFMRLEPKGRFYLRRALEDDIAASPRSPESLSSLDFGLPVIRCAEAIAVGIAFVRAMGCAVESTSLGFAFRWSKLKGRVLTSWAQQGRYLSPSRRAHQDEVVTFVNVPLETSLQALGGYVGQVVQPLYQVFDGFSLDNSVIEDLTTRLIERRL